MVLLMNETFSKQISLHKRKLLQFNLISLIAFSFFKSNHSEISSRLIFITTCLKSNTFWSWILSDYLKTHTFFKQSTRLHVMSGLIWSKSSRMLQTNQEAHMDAHSLDRRLNLFRTVRRRYPRPNHRILLVYTLSGTLCLPAQLTSAPWFSSYCH